MSVMNSELAKKNIHPHRLGSARYGPKVEKWRAEAEAARQAGVPYKYENFDERTEHWVRAREVKDIESGQLVIPDAHTEAAVEAIKALAQKKMQSEFKPRREVDELSVALGNKEHPGHVWDVSSKLGLKHGFPQESSSYRTRQCYKDDLFDTLYKKADAYIDEKIN